MQASPISKISADEGISSYKITNVPSFNSYLKDVWVDLTQRSDSKEKGITKLTFTSYYKLPGIISDCLFNVFDASKTGFGTLIEFVSGMSRLFTSDYDKLTRFVFDFYDFDKDGYIAKEDIRTVLSYVALNEDNNSIGYLARVNSQEELHEILETCFKDIIGIKLTYTDFTNIIENVNSDIYFFILIFGYSKKPFSKKNISQYEKKDGPSPTKTNDKKIMISPVKYVASPNIHSSFSPSQIVKRENKKRNTGNNPNGDCILLNYPGRKEIKKRTEVNGETKSPTKGLSKFHIDIETNVNQQLPNNFHFQEDDEPVTQVCRRKYQNLKNIDKERNQEMKNHQKYNDGGLGPAYKQTKNNKNETPKNEIIKSNSESSISGEIINKKREINLNELNTENYPGSDITEQNELNENLNFSDKEDDNLSVSSNSEEVLSYSGYGYKLIDNKKLKKLFFKLVHKDGYYYKNEKETKHKGMHNLSGVFIREDKPKVFNEITFYNFSIIYPKKIRCYYCDDEDIYKSWLLALKQATGYTNGTDIYEIKEKLGVGKFGLVRLGINKQTGLKVAIKIMSKKDMNNEDKELVNTEIEILKICQHPNIIRGYDIFENTDYYYIIMEYCAGGDGFSYIEKRGFRGSEKQTCSIIHKICAAVFYINFYGIAHRDLKPENVLMTSTDETPDIRIGDFGGSKIIGPDEFCTEPYGTGSYVAPEVLLDQPYGKAVDMWSIGVMTFGMLSGHLPFNDYQDENEIARKTISEPVEFKRSIWKKMSKESIDFINRLLEKNPKERMTVKEALEHDWIKKDNEKVSEKRMSKDHKRGSGFMIYSSTQYC